MGTSINKRSTRICTTPNTQQMVFASISGMPCWNESALYSLRSLQSVGCCAEKRLLCNSPNNIGWDEGGQTGCH